MPDPMERLRALQGADLPVHGGRTLAYVYDAGDPEIDRIAQEAVAAYAASNALDPTAFPSLLQMENELVGFACTLLDAPPGAVGTVTSGGTESILLAVQGARDSRSEVAAPKMVLPATAHAAFHKAAHYFGVEAVLVPVGPDFRADAAAMAAAIDEDTVLVVASAPSYAHGVVDPVSEIAAAAAARGVRCHVDACIGGWVLPYAARLGRPVTPWTFAVEGVTSISVDTHKYAYAPKGTSILLHRDTALRKPQFFASAAWPGYTMLNATTQSTRSGGPIAGTWAVVEHIGDDGYLALADQAFAAVDAIVACIESEPALRLVVAPESTLVTLATDETCDPFTLTDELVSRGWYVQPQLSFGDDGPSIHLSVSAGTLVHVEELASALTDSVAAAREVGPVAVDAGVVAFIESLDPATLGDDDFDGLLAASGLVGESAEGDLELPDPDGRGQRDARRRLTGDARGAAGGLPRPSAEAQPMSSLAGLVASGRMAPDWAEVLAPVDDQVAAMGRFLRDEDAAGRGYQPAAERIFRAFERPLAAVRVLVVGQDPYPNPTHPIGLSFAVERTVWPLPPSLVNIYVELRDDLGIVPPRHGDLSAWADQGVMLLNRSLTVRPGDSNSHQGKGWEAITERAIVALAERGGPAVGDPLGPARPVAEAAPRPGAVGRVGPPLAAERAPGILRLEALQPGQPAARGAGRGPDRLDPAGVRHRCPRVVQWELAVDPASGQPLPTGLPGEYS